MVLLVLEALDYDACLDEEHREQPVNYEVSIPGKEEENFEPISLLDLIVEEDSV